MRVYKTVRLAYETKLWIEQLIVARNRELQKEIRENQLIDLLENSLFDANGELLNGISINISLNVTGGSVIEQAVRYSRGFTLEEWQKIVIEMESEIKTINDVSLDDSTPRLYINQEIIIELEELQIFLKRDGGRPPRLSYIIKLVIYALKKVYI